MGMTAIEPRRIPSKKWRELIKKVWEADPPRCPKCSREMRIVSLIDEEDVIERIRAISGSGKRGCACIAAPTRRAKRPSIRGSTTLPRLRHRAGRGVLRHLKRPAAPESASRTPCSATPSPPAAAVFDFRAPLLSLCAHGNARFRLQTPGQRPGGPKAISYQ